MWLSAMGVSAVVGATAAILWAPASGSAVRTRLVTSLSNWWRTVQGRANSWQHRLPRIGRPQPMVYGGPNLSMQPNRLLTEN